MERDDAARRGQVLWHELLHYLLPGRGHDAEFRRLETLWPDSDAHDHALDSIHERFDASVRTRTSTG